MKAVKKTVHFTQRQMTSPTLTQVTTELDIKTDLDK